MKQKTLKTIAAIILFTFCLGQPAQGAINITSLSLNTILHFASGFVDSFQDLTGTKKRVNLKNNENQLSILNVSFQNLAQTMDDLQQGNAEIPDDDANVDAEVIGQALVFPSPFRQIEGAQLGYRLSKNMDVEIHFYDMLANLIIKKGFKPGSIGGKKGYNKIDINIETFDGFFLSAGVYFYVLVNNGNVLTKGKVAVIP